MTKPLRLFLAITYVLCVGYDLLFPGHAMNETWLRLLPGFSWLSWGSFLLGLIESFAYGWYVALVFGPLYNFFAAEVGVMSHHSRRPRPGNGLYKGPRPGGKSAKQLNILSQFMDWGAPRC